MTATRRVPSTVLVALQFGLILALVVATRWPVPSRAWPPTLFLLAVSVVLGVWTLGYNRWGNFNIRPELKSGARLVTGGPYRRIRHPMYASVLLGVGALVVADPRPWRIALLAALLVVLMLKAAREEHYLRAAFPEYAAYASRTWRLVPFVY
ncbi:MAG TPA: isoprenylcysteine carboxylmethyltransferase family protein [Burkholderiaceae bacterium]|nr:isoprenylcysteine carboxylmethyltransferase family protein [Burkholderiaceae bacterium]